MNRYQTTGRALVWVLILVAVAGTAGGFAAGMLFSRRGGRAGNQAEAGGAADKQLYTCGMHPNVIQEGPGNCPICGMKLTPLKAGDEEGETDAAGPKERKVLYWRAPMDPNYISDKPGQSPMGMDLVPVYAEEEAAPTAGRIRIDPVTVQNMGIRTEKLARGPLIKTIRTVGRVDYDEQLVTFVNTKFEGWIEKLHVDETGQHVAKGQPLFDVYSRELWEAQAAFLASLRHLSTMQEATFADAREDARLQIEADRMRLRNYDISEQQIDKLAESKEIQKTLTIYSPAEGIVTDKMALEGMYVKPGMQLYTIADLSRVWVYVDTYEYQLPWVGVGQSATMALPYIPGKAFEGRVVYVYPYLDAQTRVVKVRLEFENPGLELKPDMYANITLRTELDRDALLIPRSAYIDSGTRKVAFQSLGNGKFQPREIQTGVEAEDGMVEVLYGLDEGDVVVTSGQFLLDGESKLKEAIAKMREPDRSEPTPPMATMPAEQSHGMPAEAPDSATGHRMSGDRQPAPESHANHGH